MRYILTGFVAMLMAGAAAAQVMECIDAKGKKEYAQSCPPGTIKETKLMNSGAAPSGSGTAAAAPAAKSVAEREAEFRKRNMERQEAEAKNLKDQTAQKDAQRNCENARGQLKALQDGQRILRADPKTGERNFLEDKDRSGEIAAAQKVADSWCNKK